eukprot:TRINITY_DN1531_c0_g1_i1.p2 TRINITY_DN1531_c0_g1~~TRINITY_DN1531_c0_g1_i1.p2  ORF type:complete len:677 (-),score=114.80 TRINITY_DN1531_c0_g1_i1:13434-15464(-)
MGRGGKNLAYVVSGITSLLVGRKLQGPGIQEITQSIVSSFVDIMSYTKGVAENVLDYAKNALTSQINGHESAFKTSFNNSVAALFQPLRQLNLANLGRIQLMFKTIPAPKEIQTTLSVFEKLLEGSVGDVQVKNLGKELEVLKSLSAIELITAMWICLSEEPEAKGKEEEKKKEKKKKKITHGKGTAEILSYMVKAKFYNKEDLGKSIQDFCPLYDSEEFADKVSEEMTSHNEAQRIPKLPKGTRDSEPLPMAIKNYCIDIIKGVFKSHGALEIDTPVFELKETLMGKYGEESKLIYDLADQGGELLSLRYDLTVPFARYMAYKKLANFKRYHIGKVYRRETPQISKGRYREFYQCDYDIAGNCSSMIAESEILFVISDVLKKLGIGEFVTIINHRGLLNAMVELSGCEKTKFKTICSSIDKLDKSPWEEVYTELVDVKGLTKEQAENLHRFTELKGKPKELLKLLKEKAVFAKHTEAVGILDQMELLAKYTEALGIEDTLLFDLSLARGLDYYTGLIFEVKLKDPKYGVGSIAGGGRYDNLIGMFAGKPIPSVGFSFGIERLFTIMEDKLQDKIRPNATKVLVSSIGKDMVAEKMKICRELWDSGIESELLYLDNPKPQKQLTYALENYIPVMVWIGEEEVKQGTAKVKFMETKEEFMVPRGEIVKKVKELLKQS